MSIEIRLLKKTDETKWDEYVERNHASLYHYSKWRHLIKNIFGHDSYYLFAIKKEEIVGVLPLVRQKSILFGDNLVSMPYFNYGGPVGDTVQIENQLIDEAEKLRASLSCSHVELRDIKKRDTIHSTKVDKVTMLLDLPSDSDVLWKSIGAKRRSQINRPIREGVEFYCGGEELIDDFYSVFSINMRDLGTPVYSKNFFREMMKIYPEKTLLAVVKLKGEPVGAGFLIGHKGKLEIPWASTLRKVNKIGVNMFLYWNILKTAIEKNYQTFDFGRSSKDAGTLRFKKQWGAEPVQLYWNYLLPAGATLPEINPNNPKFNLMISIWKKIPVFITKIIGPRIVKNLP